MKKASFEKVLKAFDEIWIKHSKLYDNSGLLSDWNKTVESMGWTDEEFDEELHKRYQDDSVVDKDEESEKEKAA